MFCVYLLIENNKIRKTKFKKKNENLIFKHSPGPNMGSNRPVSVCSQIYCFTDVQQLEAPLGLKETNFQ